MKKFLIISIILILLAGTVFSVSLFHYVDVTKGDSTPDEVPTQKIEETQAETQVDVELPAQFNDNGMFSENYEKAYAYMQDMSTQQMVGQLIVGTCPTDDTAKSLMSKYALSGFVFSVDNFYDMSADDIKSAISSYQNSANVKMIMAVEEEGGAVTTLSDLDAFPEYDFYSPRDTFAEGGMETLTDMETQKATMLSSVGINLNLAPVCDMAQEATQLMYSRSLGGTVNETSQYVSEATSISQGKGVSVALKHFPGYGTTPDTYGAVAVDSREVSEFEQNDFMPFKAGIAEGAHCVMVSNALVEKLDPNCIASLSDYAHTVLKNELDFSGIIITDNLDNDDYSEYANGNDVYVQAVLAGNDLIYVDDVESAYKAVLGAVNDGTISEDMLKKACMRVLAYKYTAGIM